MTASNLDGRKQDAERLPDGYDMIMSYIMRQYRRRLRVSGDEVIVYSDGRWDYERVLRCEGVCVLREGVRVC